MTKNISVEYLDVFRKINKGQNVTVKKYFYPKGSAPWPHKAKFRKDNRVFSIYLSNEELKEFKELFEKGSYEIEGGRQ